MQEEEEGDMAGESAGLSKPAGPRGVNVGAVVWHRQGKGWFVALHSEFQLKKTARPAGTQRSSAERIFCHGVFLFSVSDEAPFPMTATPEGPAVS